MSVSFGTFVVMVRLRNMRGGWSLASWDLVLFFIPTDAAA
jgi:hypothetical protein